MTGPVRIDKWLWAVRLYKTRSLATAACKAGHVLVNERKVKPSRDVQPGEIVKAQTGEVMRTVRVLGLIDKRVGAALARDYAEDLTPPEEYTKRRGPDFSRGIVRPKGTGRPTKKERRAIDSLQEEPPAGG